MTGTISSSNPCEPIPSRSHSCRQTSDVLNSDVVVRFAGLSWTSCVCWASWSSGCEILFLGFLIVGLT
jgi:hypothetical protein